MNNDELAQHGFELCEFGDSCDGCHNEIEEGQLFFHRTSIEVQEGDYLCRICAVEWIREDWAKWQEKI